jgi:ribA/ribD-fused uncharacterized protein
MENNIIDKFEGDFRFLSNFYPSEVEMDGIVYPSVEHAYQAAKTFDLELRQKISQDSNPSAAKKAGRTLKIRPDWEEVKLSIMESLVRQKFSKEPFKTKLQNTGNAKLIEGNWWGDKFYGVYKGQGENHLGKILEKVRDGLLK